MANIKLNQLATVYPGGVRAVDSMDLEIQDGEFFALLGPSGCGKTTLLRTIAGLEPSSEGEVWIDDANVTTLDAGKRHVAMVFQDYALFPHMTVSENIGYPLRIRKVAKAKRDKIASDTADELSLDGLLERRPGQLSGGQQQRVALARAIASEGAVLLLDEPLSNLDARLRLEARTFLKKLQRDLAITTVFVTHDQAEALALADRIAVMEAGKLRQVGTPREVFQRPTNVMVANFIGSTPMNLLPGTVTSRQVRMPGGALDVPSDSTVTDGAEVTVGVRPEYLTVMPAGSAATGLTGTVAIIENLGVSSLVTLDCDGTLIGVTVPEEDEPAVGETVMAVPGAGRVLLYDTESGDLLADPVQAAVSA